MGSFDVGAFDNVASGKTGNARNFPLRVESYDLSGANPLVMGVDLVTGSRVRVFLRPVSSNRRPEIRHYATDPYASLTDDDIKNRAKLAAIAETLEAKCFTPAGGVLMVQGAYDDPAAGAVSASWINRVSTGAAGDGLVLSGVWARLNEPYSKDSGKKPLFMVDVAHMDKKVKIDTLADFNARLFEMLAMSATEAAGQTFVLIALRSESGKVGVQAVQRRQEKDGDVYKAEQVDASINRFWNSLPPGMADALKEGLECGDLDVMMVPGTTYRFVKNSLDALEKPATSRLGLNWEKWKLPEAAGTGSGWMLASVCLRPHKGTGDVPAGDEDWYPTDVFTLETKAAPVVPRQMQFF